MADDVLRMDAPAALAERNLLRSLKVGDKRKSALMPALPEGLEWTCTEVELTKWVFEGRFCGLTALVCEIQETDAVLLLTVKE